MRKSEEVNDSKSSRPFKTVSRIQLFGIPRYFFALMSQMILTSGIQYFQPFLAVRIKMFGYPPNFIALGFLIPSILYILGSNFVYLITQRMPKRFVIITGLLLLALGEWMIGQSKILDLGTDAEIILIGLSVIGVAACVTTIPILPECLESTEDNQTLDYEAEEVATLTAASFSTINSMGSFSGPWLSAFLNQFYGFSKAQEYYASGIACFALVYFFLGGGLSIFWRSEIEKEKAAVQTTIDSLQVASNDRIELIKSQS